MKRYRIFGAILILLFTTVLSVADDATLRNEARERAIAYVTAFMDGSFPEAYLMLADSERDGVSISQFESYIRATFPTADLVEPVRETYPALYDFVLKNLYALSTIFIEELDGMLRVNIELSTIDLLSVAFEIAEKYPEVNSGERTDTEINEIYKKALSELYDVDDPPRTNLQVPIGVIQVDDRLVVLPGIRKSFDRMRAGELSGEAWDARFDGRIEYAASLYTEAVELDPENLAYQQELASLNLRLDQMKGLLELEPSEYAKEYLSIETSEADVTGFPVIICSIRNNGDKTIERLGFRVVYLDELKMLMAVEIGTYAFWNEPLGVEELKRDVRIDTYEAPFGWSGNHYHIELIDENPR